MFPNEPYYLGVLCVRAMLYLTHASPLLHRHNATMVRPRPTKIPTASSPSPPSIPATQGPSAPMDPAGREVRSLKGKLRARPVALEASKALVDWEDQVCGWCEGI